MTRLRGRTVVITGAGSGLGRALALAFAGRDAALALSDVDTAAATETARLAAARTTRQVTAHRVDVADRAAVLAHADEVASVHGAVHVLVNNAGVILAASATEQSFAGIDRVLAIDLGGVVNGTQAFLPALVATGDGHVVTISSIFGLVAAPSLSAYATAKSAVRGYTEAVGMDLALEGAGVRTTCVHPGGMRTDLGASARTEGSLSPRGMTALFDRIAFTQPGDAARRIVRAVERDRRRLVIGPDARVMYVAERLLGGAYQPLMVRVLRGALAGARHRDEPGAAAGRDRDRSIIAR